MRTIMLDELHTSGAAGRARLDAALGLVQFHRLHVRGDLPFADHADHGASSSSWLERLQRPACRRDQYGRRAHACGSLRRICLRCSRTCQGFQLAVLSALLRFQAMESFSAVAVSKMDSAASIFVMYRSQFDELYKHFCVDITQPLQFYGPDRRTSDTYQLPCRTCLTPRQLPKRDGLAHAHTSVFACRTLPRRCSLFRSVRLLQLTLRLRQD